MLRAALDCHLGAPEPGDSVGLNQARKVSPQSAIIVSQVGVLPFNNNLLAGAVLALSLVSSSLAIGQDATNTALARSLFEDGIAHTEAGEWEQAAERFERSLALHPSEVVSFNAGVALVHLERLVEAREFFRAAATSDSAQLVEAARAHIEELSPRIGSLQIHIEGTVPEHARVLLDGTALPQQALGVAIPVDPTPHTVQVIDGEQTLAEETVIIAEGGSDQITLTLIPTAAEVAEQVELPDETGPVLPGEEGDDTLLIATMTGGAVIAVTIVVVVLALAFSGNHPPVEGNLGPGVLELGR